MQYRSCFIKSLLLLIILVIIYIVFYNYFNLIDQKCFLLLNKYLLFNSWSQHFWGILSHKNESWINVIIMIAINILSVFILSKEKEPTKFINSFNIKFNINSNNSIKRKLLLVFYCWMSFQVVLLINSLIFNKILNIHRDSPSIFFANNIRLSEILGNINIKDYSYNSFPAGHALVVIYWIAFIHLYSAKCITYLSILIGATVLLTRMITGAHWLSDTIFSLILGWMYFNLSMWFASNYEQIKNRLS